MSTGVVVANEVRRVSRRRETQAAGKPTTVLLAMTNGEREEVESLGRAGNIHLVRSKWRGTYRLVESVHGTSFALVSKKVGLAFLWGARTGRTTGRMIDLCSVGEEHRARTAHLSAATRHAGFFAARRYIRILEKRFASAKEEKTS